MRIARALAVVLLAGCQQGAAIGASCTRGSDCTSPLVCTLGSCRAACASDRDCPVSARCLRVAGVGACSLAEESNCPALACPSGTVCVGGACASSCATDTDCPGGPCIDVTIGGTTVRGCADARAGDAGVSDASADIDAGAMPRLTLFAGLRTTCALTPGGDVYCWGANEGGQLGDSVVTHAGPCTDPDTGMVGDYSVTPVHAAITGATQIAVGGGHACARVPGSSGLGEARCWGYNGAGELGHATSGDRSVTPLTVVDMVGAPVTGVVYVGAWGNGSAAATTTGLLAWGDQHDAAGGVLGTGNVLPPLAASLPTGVTITRFVMSEVGVGIDGDAHVRTWGWNVQGTLGQGTDDASPHVDFTVVSGIEGARAVALGVFAACARTDTDVLCWGAPWAALAREGNHGTCPTSTGEGSSCPVSVSGLSARPLEVAVSATRTCIVIEGGSVLCTDDSETLVPRTDLPAMRSIVAGDRFFCGIDTNERVHCWGDDFCGQTGDPGLGLDLPAHEVVLP